MACTAVPSMLEDSSQTTRPCEVWVLCACGVLAECWLGRERTLGARTHHTRTVEQCIMPHLAAAYNLARWLTRHDQDAEDVVQEAFLRAYKFFSNFHGGDSRAWLLTIVRNTCYTWLRQNRAHELTEEFD